MKTLKQLKAKLKELGAEFQEDKYAVGEGAIVCVAPDNKQWVSGECIHMTVSYYNFTGMRQEAISDAYERVCEGLEDLDTELNA